MTAKTKLVTRLVLAIVLLDQTSKIIIDRAVPFNHTVPVIANLLNLTYIRNTGAAFGIFSESAETFRLPFLILFSLLAIVFLITVLRRLPETAMGLTVALAFILGGAIGNLIDRLLYGEVIDFLDFYWSRFHWPAFNFADSFITVGVAITLYRLIKSKGQDPFAHPAK